MQTGTVIFFNDWKGFGFIKSSDGKELQVHVSGLRSGLIREADSVTFDVKEGKKGPMAVNVRRL